MRNPPTPALRAENIVQVHVSHTRDCRKNCGPSFVCARCRRRYGECRRHFFYVRRCISCAAPLLPAKGRA